MTTPQQNLSKPRIPKNLCQSCYQQSGRYILDCYCIICEQCYTTNNNKKNSVCSLCGRHTKGHKIDAKQETSIRKIQHLFQNVDVSLQRVLEVYKFQNQIVNRYCRFMENELTAYRKAVRELIEASPSLFSFFHSRVNLKKAGVQSYDSRSLSISHRPDKTIKPNLQQSQILQSRRTTLQLNQKQPNYRHQHPPNTNSLPNYISSSIPIPNPNSNPNSIPNNSINNPELAGIRPIGRGNTTQSGNVIYKVPNINYNTAVRSSKRVSKGGYEKYEPDYDDEYYYRRNR